MMNFSLNDEIKSKILIGIIISDAFLIAKVLFLIEVVQMNPIEMTRQPNA
jgi:hypothetical protein